MFLSRKIPFERSDDDALAERRVRDYNEETLSYFSPLIPTMKFANRPRLLMRVPMSRERRRDVTIRDDNFTQNCSTRTCSAMTALIGFDSNSDIRMLRRSRCNRDAAHIISIAKKSDLSYYIFMPDIYFSYPIFHIIFNV